MRFRAWPGLILAASVASGAFGQAAPEPSRPGRDSIDLAARRVVVWRAGGDQWVALHGEVAVLQGSEGVRAREAVARITSGPAPGATVYRVEVYAEGPVEPGGRVALRRAVRRTFATIDRVRLTAYDPTQLTHADGPPPGSPLPRRAGFAPRVDPRPSGLARSAPAAEAEAPRFRLQDPAPPDAAPGSRARGVKADPAVRRAQRVAPAAEPEPEPGPGPGPGDDADPEPEGGDGLPPLIEAPALETAPTVPSLRPGPGADEGPASDLPSPLPALEPGPEAAPSPAAPPRAPATDLAPLPAPGSETVEAPPALPPGAAPNRPRPEPEPLPDKPILPESRRITRIYPGGALAHWQRLPMVNGVDTYVFRGGVNIVTEAPGLGVIDITADNAVLWRTVDAKGRSFATGPSGEQIDSPNQPLEFYLEGNIIFRQDERKVAGNGDQKTYRAKAAYFNVLTNRFIGLDSELEMFAPGLISPARVLSPRIEQYSPLVKRPDGRWAPGDPLIRADQTMSTGSRFPNPGYRFNSRSIDVFRVRDVQTDPNTGKSVGDKEDPNAPDDLVWRIDARQNVFKLGAVPIFYWPRMLADAEDMSSPLRQIGFRANNYFGQQVLSDWNAFRLFGIRRPNYIDNWNVDLDYLSARTKGPPALGSELGWFGPDLINDLSDPYNKVKGEAPSWLKDYFGYFDIWGLRDYGNDILGSGPAVITDNRRAGKRGYQRGGGGLLGSVPPFQDFRGRTVFRHMQRFLPDDDEHVYEDLRAQLEFGYISDRHFLEEYYKRLFDVGLDHETLFYLLRSKDNWAYSVMTEANLQNWYTDTQWLPRFDYYRLGDSFANLFTYYTHSGVDYANVHTAVEVNNPYIFAFIPFDPVSNTTGPWSSGRGYTSHELDLKLNVGNVFRIVPYVQGQAVGWTEQIDGRTTGRLWGAAGVRADFTAWKAYPWVQSELLNVHGINHKINFEVDYRDAWSNMRLNQTGVQDDLDDNTYEFVRRYFALTNYAGGVLPQQYDPRHLILRRMISPITGTTDLQSSLNSLHMGIHQRLQTKRGPDGKRRIIDYMTLDLDTTYYPYAQRDNFGMPFGQNMYNWQWFIGDRTSIMSYGWFEFWKLNGYPIYNTNIDRHNNPFGLDIVTTGISLSRPPRGNVFIGYSVVNTGPINTSALTTSVNYWMSPKWYGTYSTMYDFGNAILLSAMGSVTRVGADYLTSIGLTVDPQRQSYMFAFMISPRLSPNLQLGNGVGLNNFDTRYAPTQ